MGAYVSSSHLMIMEALALEKLKALLRSGWGAAQVFEFVNNVKNVKNVKNVEKVKNTKKIGKVIHQMQKRRTS